MNHTKESISRTSIRNEYDCGCKIIHDGGGAHIIKWCKLHASAPKMLKALQEIESHKNMIEHHPGYFLNQLERILKTISKNSL